MPVEFNSLKLLNLGCGSSFHPSWVNVDFVASDPSVVSCNLLQGIPFSDSHFDAVYHSHVLEHFPKEQALLFLSECFRVLKKGGIVRVVVPDLEAITNNYLKWLHLAMSGDKTAQANYEWMLLEMYDQTVRQFRGGAMGLYLKKKDLMNKDFILSRIGTEAEFFWKDNVPQPSLLRRMKNLGFVRCMQYIRIRMTLMVTGLLGGRSARLALEEGLFRRSGEIHLWMYDRFSLKQLLEQAGFADIKVCRADESQIANFNQYQLDVVNGKIRKPDSLFIEAMKP